MNSGNPDEKYELLELIGEGSYGVVYRGIDKDTNQSVAVKILPNDDQTSVRELQLEIDILKEASCPFVVDYYGCYVLEEEYWIVMEECAGGSALDLIEAAAAGTDTRGGGSGGSPLSEAEVRAVVASAALGLRYLHRNHSIHRDIKAGNILLTANGTAKLADFGVSAKLVNTLKKRNTVIGSPYWMAPEVIQETAYDGKADVWSLGVTAVELAEGNPPLHGVHPMRAIFMIPSKPAPTLKEEEKWSPEFCQFVRFCLNKKVSDRPDTEAVCGHPFVQADVADLQVSAAHPLLRALVARMAGTLNKYIDERNTNPEGSLKNQQLAARLSKRRLGTGNSAGTSGVGGAALGLNGAAAAAAAADGGTLQRRAPLPRRRGPSGGSGPRKSGGGAGARVRSEVGGVPLDSKGSLLAVVRHEGAGGAGGGRWRSGSRSGEGAERTAPVRRLSREGSGAAQPARSGGLAAALKYFQPKAPASSSNAPTPVAGSSRQQQGHRAGQPSTDSALFRTPRGGARGGNGGASEDEDETVSTIREPLSTIVTDLDRFDAMELDLQKSIQAQLEILDLQYNKDLNTLHTAYLEKRRELEKALEQVGNNDTGGNDS